MTASVKSPVDAAPPRSTVAQPSARAAAIALSTASAAGASPTCLISMAALSIMEAGLATPQPAMSGALPWAASKSAWLAPTFAEPRSPSEPTTPPARSDTMSPQQLGATSTSYACGWSTSPAQRESTSASSYRRPAAEAALRASSRKSPSDCLQTFALWTAVTRLGAPRSACRCSARAHAYSAMRAEAPRLIRFVAWQVSLSTHTSGAPQYRSSVFSRTMSRSTATSPNRVGHGSA
mmetsp:Transcript_34328/g.113138  ORF Transcript_34328/g.113138 Transcript_34328/m.113138 type:complete len:236 (+) Transcript_34328:85-792(+)